jgi:hypothetical protein
MGSVVVREINKSRPYAASTVKRVIGAITGTPRIGLATYDGKHEDDGVKFDGGD